VNVFDFHQFRREAPRVRVVVSNAFSKASNSPVDRRERVRWTETLFSRVSIDLTIIKLMVKIE